MNRVIIVSPVRLYREGLAQVLRRDGRLEVLAAAPRVGALRAEQGLGQADAVLLDMTAPGALAAVRRTLRIFPEVKVIALGLAEIERDILPCAEAGVAGYVSREASVRELVETVQRALQSELRCSARIAGALLEQVARLSRSGPRGVRPSHLTAREREVLRLIDRGMTNKAIAGRLCIQPSTVKNHVHNILAKLEVQTRGEAAAKVRRLSDWPRWQHESSLLPSAQRR